MGTYESRFDYIFFGCTTVEWQDCSTLEYGIGAAIVGGCPVIPFTVPKYLADLILVATDAACGTVTITPSSAPESHLVDEHGMLIEPLDIEGLTLDFSGGPTLPDCNRNGQPDEEEGLEPGDFDFNHTVDLADFAAFQRCFHGDCALSETCVCVFDFTEDDAVDCADLSAFTSRFGGP